MTEADREEGRRIDQLVFRFQAGDDKAGEEVLRLFGGHPDDKVNNYIGKYYHMLRNGRFPFKDKDSRTFINCYIKDPAIRKAMKRARQHSHVMIEALKAVHHLEDQCKPISDEELLQDLRMLFIQQMKRYKKRKKEVWFPGYLYKSYGFALVVHINKKFKPLEPYMHMYTEKQIIPMQEDIHVDDDTCIELDERKFTKQPSLVDDDKIGNSWVRGLTCGDEFTKLTALQRLIIKLYYHDDSNDRKIAEKINMHINTIHKQRKRAVQIIQDTMDELFRGGYEL
jgi:DNA-directed RNA polymerase specialized sigma24 family protein